MPSTLSTEGENIFEDLLGGKNKIDLQRQGFLILFHTL